ncbi:peptidylprolyl isomerase [Elusimicrobiota bacterium]
MNFFITSKWSYAAAIAVLFCSGCDKFKPGGSSMIIEKGSSVTIEYTLTVDGEVVDTSVGREPLSFVQGSGQIIPGLEEQLEGMKAGDQKKVTIAPEKGYGTVMQDAFQKVPRSAFKNIDNLKVNDVVSGQSQGRPFRARVAGIEGEEVTLDLNHPLAGKTLNFDVKVIQVKPNPKDN